MALPAREQMDRESQSPGIRTIPDGKLHCRVLTSSHHRVSETGADSAGVTVMSPIDVGVALENVATKQNDLKSERSEYATHKPQTAPCAVRLYEAALDILNIERALGVPPGSPSMFTDPSEKVYDCRHGLSSTNLVATIEKDTHKNGTNLSQFSKYCTTIVDTKKTVSPRARCSTSTSNPAVKKQAVQRSCVGKVSHCGQSSLVSTKVGVRAAGLKRPPPGSKPLHDIANLRRS